WGTAAAFLDGDFALDAKDSAILAGSPGLSAWGAAGAVFDDFAAVEGVLDPVESRSAAKGFVAARARAARAADVIPDRFRVDSEMQVWSGPRSEWEFSRVRGAGWLERRGVLLGPATLRIPSVPEGGLFEALFERAGREGRTLRIRASRREGRLLLEAVPEGGAAVRAEGDAPPADSLSLSWGDGSVRLAAVGREIAAVKASPPPATRLSVRLSGRFRPEPPSLDAEWAFDEIFARAPADWWTPSGNWEVTSRWACEPELNFFSASGPRLSLAATKASFGPDVSVRVSLAPRMQVRRYPGYGYPIHAGIGIGVQGLDPGSGYTLFWGGTDLPTALYRRDRLLASTEELRVPALRGQWRTILDQIHKAWFTLDVDVCGGRIRVLCDGRKILEADDPEPLPAGRVALWSAGGEMSFARVRVLGRPAEAAVPPAPPLPLPPAAPGARKSLSFDFRNSPGECAPSAEEGAAIRVEPAGLVVSNPRPGGAFALSLLGSPFDAAAAPRLRFRANLPPNLSLALTGECRGLPFAFPLAGEVPHGQRAVLGDMIVEEGAGGSRWRRGDIGGRLRRVFPSGPLPVDRLEIRAIDPAPAVFAGIAANRLGSSWTLEALEIGGEAVLDAQPRPGRVLVGGVDATGPRTDFPAIRNLGGPDGYRVLPQLGEGNEPETFVRLVARRLGASGAAEIDAGPVDARRFPALLVSHRFDEGFRADLLVAVGERELPIAFHGGVRDRWMDPNDQPVSFAFEIPASEGRFAPALLDLERLLRDWEPPLARRVLLSDTARKKNDPRAGSLDVDRVARVLSIRAGEDPDIRIEGVDGPIETAWAEGLSAKAPDAFAKAKAAPALSEAAGSAPGPGDYSLFVRPAGSKALPARVPVRIRAAGGARP
ncbi:MAG: hypothetical protein AAB215_09595, partial [Planctomycetota bacterium]